MTQDTLNTLIEKLGKEIGIEGLSLDEDGFCCLAFDEKITVNIQYEESENNVIFFAEVGIVSPKEQAETFPLLLEANLLTIGTQGATLGAERETGSVLLSLRVPVSTLDYAAFHKSLETFVNTAEIWIDRLEKGPAVEKGQDDSFDPESTGSIKA